VRHNGCLIEILQPVSKIKNPDKKLTKRNCGKKMAARCLAADICGVRIFTVTIGKASYMPKLATVIFLLSGW
jgi:hypothetical protein